MLIFRTMLIIVKCDNSYIVIRSGLAGMYVKYEMENDTGGDSSDSNHVSLNLKILIKSNITLQLI
jgi:hypothetical protein